MKKNIIPTPLFEVQSNPTISIANIKNRRFNLIDRGEPHAERIADDLLTFRRRDNEYELTREYVINYIKKYKTFVNLRAALKDVAPEFEAVLDKLSVLK